MTKVQKSEYLSVTTPNPHLLSLTTIRVVKLRFYVDLTLGKIMNNHVFKKGRGQPLPFSGT